MKQFQYKECPKLSALLHSLQMGHLHCVQFSKLQLLWTIEDLKHPIEILVESSWKCRSYPQRKPSRQKVPAGGNF